MTEICQTSLPVRPWADPRLARLPGLVPVAEGDWPQVDDAYGAQMAHRAAILSRKGAAVLRVAPAAAGACAELLDTVLAALARRTEFARRDDSVTCPDGRMVTIDRTRPLQTLNALVQEDFCLLQKPVGADEHVLTAALLCFPASWSLDQKFLRPLVRIHRPVESYDAGIARRVQRLFDGVQPGRPVWRANALVYDDPELHQPRREEARRDKRRTGPKYLRSERQTLLRLPESRAVVFSIHTVVVPFSALSPEDVAALSADGDRGPD